MSSFARSLAVALLAAVVAYPADSGAAQILTGTVAGTFDQFSHSVDGGAGDGGQTVAYTLLAFNLPSTWSSLESVDAIVTNLVDQGWGNTFAGNNVQLQLLHSGTAMWSTAVGHADHTPATYTLNLTATGSAALFSTFETWQPLGQLSLAMIGNVAGWPGAALNGSGGSLTAIGLIGGTTTISGSASYPGTTTFDTNDIALTGTLTAGTVIVGNTNSGIGFVIEGSGSLSDSQTIVGNSSNSGSNTIVVTGPGAAWTSTAGFSIGNAGSSNALTIAAGGVVSAGSGIQIVGSGTSATGNALVVTGSGSVLQSTAALKIGFNGDGNTLLVDQGGRITGSFAVIGDNLGDGNTATVTGVGSSWSAGNSVFVGNTGSDNSLFVLAGGSVSGASYVAIGQNANSGGNSATVSGTGSILTTDGALAVGNSGSRNTLVISAGGTVSDDYGVIGAGSTSSNNAVLVTGTGSIWTNATAVDIGYAGTNNDLTVANGGVVDAPVVNIALQPGSSGGLTIGGGQAAGTVNAPVVAFGSGSAGIQFNQVGLTTFAPAITGTGAVLHAGPGTTILTGSSTNAGSVTVAGGVLWVNGSLGPAVVNVAANGTLTGTGTISGSVNIDGTLSAGNYYEGLGHLATGSLLLGSGATTNTGLGTAGDTSSPGAANAVFVSGSLQLGGTLTLSDAGYANGETLAGAGSYELFRSTGITSGSFQSINNLDGYRATVVTAAPSSGTTSTYLDNYMLASAAPQQTLILPAWHAGSGTSAAFMLSNLSSGAAAYTESLSSGTFTATTPGFFASGSATGIVGGTSAAGTLLAGISGTGASAGGVYSGSTTLQLISNPVAGSGLAPIVVGTQRITITGTAWNLADAVYEPVYDFGDVHVGDVAFLPVVVLNAAAANGFSEGLNMQWNASDSLDAVIVGQISNLPAGQSSLNLSYAAYQALVNGSDDFMGILLDTSSTGDKEAEFGVVANSTGATTSGLGLTALEEDPIEVTGAVYAYAAPVVSVSGTTLSQPTASLSLGNVHVGDNVPVLQLSLFNDGNDGDDDGFTEGLTASFSAATGSVTGVGTVTDLDPGATSTALSVQSSAATGGAFGGTVTLGFTSVAVSTSDLDDTELTPMTITVSGTGYAYAAPSASAAGVALPSMGATLDLGTVRIGSTAPSQTLTITNNGTANGYTESLNATFGAGGAVISGSGSIADLAPGSASPAMSISAATATAGTFTQEMQLQYTSVAVPGSGLGNTTLQPLGISVTATINALASPIFTMDADLPGASLTPEGEYAYTVNFGTVEQGSVAMVTLNLQNDIASPADALAGAWGASAEYFFLGSGFDTAFGIGEGGTFVPETAIQPTLFFNNGVLTITVDTATVGTANGAVWLSPYSMNAFQQYEPLTPISLSLLAIIEDPDNPDDPAEDDPLGDLTAIGCLDAAFDALDAFTTGFSIAILASGTNHNNSGGGGSSGGSSGGGGGGDSDPIVPEPSTYAMLIGAAGILALKARTLFSQPGLSKFEGAL